jgi:hypothetical protein
VHDAGIHADDKSRAQEHVDQGAKAVRTHEGSGAKSGLGELLGETVDAGPLAGRAGDNEKSARLAGVELCESPGKLDPAFFGPLAERGELSGGPQVECDDVGLAGERIGTPARHRNNRGVACREGLKQT